MNQSVELHTAQVAAATVLILVNVVISLLLRLGLTRTLVVASLRTVGQLLLIGWVLQWIFAQQGPWVVALAILLMTLIAGSAASARVSLRYPRLRMDTFLAMAASAWLVGLYGLMLVLGDAEPWYGAPHAIPLVGMILGNVLNGVSIGLDTLLQSFHAGRARIESRLMLGATIWEATRPERTAAVRKGMMPIINAMMVVGLVNLPGMMTGQLLAGASPTQAVRYQIVILFLIASATALGTVGAATLCHWRLTNRSHQLELAHLVLRGD